VKREIIHTEKAPKAIGPYSQAVCTDALIYTAGQLGLDPATGEFAAGGVEEQTRQALKNLKHILEAAGSSLEKAVKTTVFLKDMADFPKVNAVYAEFFPNHPPARSTIAVAALPKDGLVEIEVVALV
jgi:2-iminobutanoate/2-iminopropanoate deaminase